MGADFLLAIAPWTEKDKALDRVERLTETELAEIGGDVWYMFNDPIEPEEIRMALRYAINEVVDDDLDAPRRDMVHARIDGRWYITTGGMSGGDSPTEAFDHVWLLQLSGVTDDTEWEDRE